MEPSYAEVVRAANALDGVVHRTPLLTSRRVDAWAGRRVWMKAEHLQVSGAFKFRGAMNAILALDPTHPPKRVATHSSGNHGGALARAAQLKGIPCSVVMPCDAVPAKREAVLAYGATVVECEPALDARESALDALLAREGGVEIHPYDNAWVIAGAGTAALEMLDEAPDIEVVVAPVGGGGLASGTALAARGRDRGITVVGAEPSGADDAARSLAAGRLIRQLSANTVADGLRASLSPRTFALLAEHLERVITVTDAEILEAMALLWSATKQVVEPSGAAALAAVGKLSREEFGTRPAGVILSGGNVDLDAIDLFERSGR